MAEINALGSVTMIGGTINGKSYELIRAASSVQIKDGKVFVDGVERDLEESPKKE